MPFWAYCYLAFMCLIIPFGVYNHIKKRKSMSFLLGETIYAISCFIIVFSYWHMGLSTRLSFSIIPLTVFIIVWSIYSGWKTVKNEGAEYSDMGGFNRDIFLGTMILLSPIYILGIKQSLSILGY